MKQPPSGNILPMAFKIFVYSAKNKFSLEAAKPEAIARKSAVEVPWTAGFVDELKIGLITTKLM